MSADRSAQEARLCWKLLDLMQQPDPRVALGAILDGLVELTGARRAYLEFYSDREEREPRWALSVGCSAEEEDSIRATTSRGIVAAALATGKLVHTPHAALDERFSAQRSVREQRIEAVLCLPFGVRGVLYLEGQRGAGPFSEANVELVEKIGRHLSPALERAVREGARRHAEDRTRGFREKLRLDDIVGRSEALARVFEQLGPVARLDVTVLLSGPSGTGKTQLARAIHDNSPRRAGPFVELNCAALPEGLIESELFGTMPGAFPGARRVAGKVEAAEGGSLFLDEIAEIPVASQAKLLQLLQSRRYYALASTRLATANIRLIAATNVDLATAVEDRRFREDLFYRINVINLRMPSLAERREDIPLLVQTLLTRAAEEHRAPLLPPSEELIAILSAMEWPGNVRQLRHRLEA